MHKCATNGCHNFIVFENPSTFCDDCLDILDAKKLEKANESKQITKGSNEDIRIWSNNPFAN